MSCRDGRNGYGGLPPYSPSTPCPRDGVLLCVKKDIHVGVPAAADIGHHVVEGVYFLHCAVWRGVLGDQDKVLHS